MTKREEWEEKVARWWELSDFDNPGEEPSEYEVRDGFDFIAEFMKIKKGED